MEKEKLNINIAEYNAVRLKYQNRIDNATALARIIRKECKYLSGIVPNEFYVRYGFIERHANNLWQFNRNPWKYLDICKAVAEIQQLRTERRKKEKESKILSEEACINYLKARGYVVRRLIPEHWEEL